MALTDDEYLMAQYRRTCLSFVAAAMHQHQDRRAGQRSPTPAQLADIQTLVEDGNISHLGEESLTLLGMMAGIAGIIISVTDNERLLQLMILDAAKQLEGLTDEDNEESA